MTKFLSEFPPITTEAWKQAIAEDANGADGAEKLAWHSPEGINVKPFYRAEDSQGLKFLNAAPGDYPYTRGTRASGNWRIREQIDAIDPEEANTAARCAVAAGAEEIAFSHVVVTNASDLGILVANLGEIPIRFEHVSPTTVQLVLDRMIRRQSSTMRSADLDWSIDPAFSAEVIRKAPPEFAPFTIPAERFGESGATAIEEIGFALASGVDFLAQMQELGTDVNRAADSAAFSVVMGPEYFMQIAKLRALRMVWAEAAEAFGVSRQRAKARIYVRTSRWNRSVYDPHVNMLRATTEAMSAVLGGAESIYVAPFDECYSAGYEAAQRMARNTQIILKQEARLGFVVDPGGGSYYLEALTNSIAQAAWKQLQEIELAGGYRKAGDLIKSRLEQRMEEQQRSVITRRRVLTGANRFVNGAEHALDRVSGSLPHDSGRAALPFEQLRLRTERHAAQAGSLPRIVLAEIGDEKMRAARSNFVAEFFACAGLATDVEQFETPQQMAATPADLIVLCSSDPEYLSVASELLSEMRSRGSHTPVLIAGNPETAAQLRAAGVTEFIHLRSNPIELLTRLLQILGIGN